MYKGEHLMNSHLEKRKIQLTENDITLELLQDISLTMAEIVQKYGDNYLPIFIRILKEF